MLNATVELFMSEYFLIKAVLGRYLENEERLFHRLSEIFLIPAGEAEKLYRLSENEIAKSITTDKEFLRHQRMQKYSRLIGSEKKTNADWEEIVRIKGNAILTAQNSKLTSEADASKNMVYNCLSTAAAGGAVSALRIMGILQCEGIFLAKNERAGIKSLAKAADWNDCVSTLALLCYCSAARGFNMARLRQEVADTPFEELYKKAAEKYGGADGVIDEVKLLDKAFNSGVLKRETYDPKYARILNSFTLYIKDKEKAVFTLNKSQLCEISDLPLKLSHAKLTAVDGIMLREAPLKRETEIAAISRALKNSDLRCLSSYRPLCLCCDSEYVLNMYERLIGGKGDAHIEKIDVAELGEYDFEPTPNNIFVRSINEDKDNRFLLFFRGEIPERKMDAVKCILQSSRRAKFHLNSPNVTLNLSAVLPICFCDGQNAKILSPYCDEIRLGEVSAEEMSAAIADSITRIRKLYGVDEVRIAGEAEDVFGGYDIDTAERLIDAAVRARRENGEIVTLSREIFQEYADVDDKRTIGFGGGKNGRYQ